MGDFDNRRSLSFFVPIVFMRMLYRAFLLVSAIFCSTVLANDYFTMYNYPVHVIIGPSRYLTDVTYLSFSGDFGFRDFNVEELQNSEFITREKKLLSQFTVNVSNFEFILPLPSGYVKSNDDDLRALNILRTIGIDIVSLANNHVLDYGEEGISYNVGLLKEYGISVVGTTNTPFVKFRSDNETYAVFALTTFLDQEDANNIIPATTDSFLLNIKTESAKFDFNIAFVHLGSRSLYPSPREITIIDRIIDSGIDLVICTGSHWIRGVTKRNTVPVAMGIGNYLFSYTGGFSEPVGMHLVVGLKNKKLVQMLAVPFHNDIKTPLLGALEPQAFEIFQRKFLARSVVDPDNFFQDERTLYGIKETLSGLAIKDIKRIKWRHIIYGVKTLHAHYPIWTIVFALGSILLLVFLLYKIILYLIVWRSRSL